MEGRHPAEDEAAVATAVGSGDALPEAGEKPGVEIFRPGGPPAEGEAEGGVVEVGAKKRPEGGRDRCWGGGGGQGEQGLDTRRGRGRG